MGFLKKQYEKAKKGVKDEFKYRKELREAEKESYRQARMEEARKFGQKKAAYESSQRLKKVKQKPKSFEFKGFAGPTQQNPVLNIGIGDALTGSTKKKKRRDGFDDMRIF